PVGRPEVPDVGPGLPGDRVARRPEVPDGRRRRETEVVEMAVAMAGDLVARLDDPPGGLGGARHLLPDQEERRPDAERTQRLEEALHRLGLGSVVEGEAHAARPVDPADGAEQAPSPRDRGEGREGVHGCKSGGGGNHGPGPGYPHGSSSAPGPTELRSTIRSPRACARSRKVASIPRALSPLAWVRSRTTTSPGLRVLAAPRAVWIRRLPTTPLWCADVAPR